MESETEEGELAAWELCAIRCCRSTHPRHNHQRAAFDPRCERLLPQQRPEEHLPFVRVLRQPADVGASIDQAHLRLEDQRGLTLRVVLGLRALDGRRGEAKLDASTQAEVVLFPELVWEKRPSRAAVDGARDLQLGELDHGRVDAVDGGGVQVALAVALELQLEGRDAAERAEHQVVLVVPAGPRGTG